MGRYYPSNRDITMTDESPWVDESSDDTQTDSEPVTDSHSADNAKVIGSLDNDDGTGVLGHATGDGESYGVAGISDAAGDSTNDVFPAGVYGNATGSDITRGVFGESDGVDGRGVVGTANQGSGVQHLTPTDTPIGVLGASDQSSSQSGVSAGYGVIGLAGAQTGAAYGVFGRAESSGGVGISAYNSARDGYALESVGDAITEGDHEVTGAHTVGELGASVDLTSNITAQTTSTDVVYDDVDVDDRDEYDASTGEFTCDRAGTYHVEASVMWDGTPDEGELLKLAIRVNGNQEAADSMRWPTSTSQGQRISQDVSKTIRGVSSGDVIKITAQTGNSSHDLLNISYYSNLQITQIG